MARSPRFKIYDPYGVYQAACKEPEAAAAVVVLYGDGSTIKDDHGPIVWWEGEGQDGHAGDSYDVAAETIWNRIRGNK